MATTRTSHTPAIAVVAAGFLAGALAYSRLPGPFLEVAPWARILVAFTLPTTALVIYGLFRSLWRHDRIRSGNGAFEATYHAIVLCAVVFVVALHALVMVGLTGAAGTLGDRLANGRVVIVLFGLAVAAVGNLLPRTRPNIGMGVRTTRTLASAQLWQHVHRVSGYATVALGIVIAATGVLLAHDTIAPVVSAAALGATAIVFVSYRRHARA
jgi:uncharacterized membrane protein